ncbi:MAG: outer membrane protein assembly factor BamD [Pseudomonadota bacterium]
MTERSVTARALPLCVVLTSLVLAGCSGNGPSLGWFSDDDTYEPDVSDVGAPEDLYNEGLALLNEGSVTRASEKFEEVDELHPFSDYARRATLLAAYSHFERGDYDNAIASASRFVQLNPGSSDAAYAQFLIGESYFRQIETIDRDQSAAERAAAVMADLAERYPDSEYAPQARQRVRVARDQLAGKEMEIGRSYQRRGQYLGALNRYRVVVGEYQTTRHIEEALLRLTETYLALGVVSEAQTAAAVLGHNFPDSQWYRDAYSVLQSGGFEPAINDQSWLASVFDRVS